MPDDVNEEGGEDPSDRNRRAGSAEKALSEFRALSYEDQLYRRREWAKDLEKTENEISGTTCLQMSSFLWISFNF